MQSATEPVVPTVPARSHLSSANRLANAARPSLTAVSLFTGAGGLDLGCEAAGFRTRAAVESDPTARHSLLSSAPSREGILAFNQGNGLKKRLRFAEE